jgi:hypothetical protein
LNLQQPAPKVSGSLGFRGIVLDGYQARYPKMPDNSRRQTAEQGMAKPAPVDTPSRVISGTPADALRVALEDATRRGDWVEVERLAGALRERDANATSSASDDVERGAYLD